MKYTALHDISHEKLVEKVNAHLTLGFEPTGGISTCPEYNESGQTTGHILYSQALVLRGQ